jgi:hypothetical protein
LERIRRSFGLCVYGYVVMPEHTVIISKPANESSPSRTTTHPNKPLQRLVRRGTLQDSKLTSRGP